MGLTIDKSIKNRGVERNKKPLQNVVYKVEVRAELASTANLENYEKYKFKDLGYLTLSWGYEKDLNKLGGLNWHGFITPKDLKILLDKIGPKQWSKFCQGKREFVNQRRVNGKNKCKKAKN